MQPMRRLSMHQGGQFFFLLGFGRGVIFFSLFFPSMFPLCSQNVPQPPNSNLVLSHMLGPQFNFHVLQYLLWLRHKKNQLRLKISFWKKKSKNFRIFYIFFSKHFLFELVFFEFFFIPRNNIICAEPAKVVSSSYKS